MNSFSATVQKHGSEKNFHPLAILLVMAISDEVDPSHLERIEEFKQKKFGVSEMKATNSHYQNEVKRRWQLKRAIDIENGTEMEEESSDKPPSVTKINNKSGPKYLRGEEQLKGWCLKLYKHEIQFINSRIGMFLDRRKNDKDAEEQEKLQSGEHIKKSTLLKMRVIEAMHHEAFRRELVEMDNGMDRAAA